MITTKSPLFKRLETDIDYYTSNTVEVSPGVFFSQYRTIQRIYKFKNRDLSGTKLNDDLSYDYYFDIISPRADGETKNLRFDTKNILVFSQNPRKDFPVVFIANASIKKWMRDNGEDDKLKASVEEFTDNGNIGFKRVKGGYEIMDPLNTYITNTTAKTVDDTDLIERHANERQAHDGPLVRHGERPGRPHQAVDERGRALVELVEAFRRSDVGSPGMARKHVAFVAPIEAGEPVLFDLVGQTSQQHRGVDQRRLAAGLVGHAADGGGDHRLGDVPADVRLRHPEALGVEIAGAEEGVQRQIVDLRLILGAVGYRAHDSPRSVTYPSRIIGTRQRATRAAAPRYRIDALTSKSSWWRRIRTSERDYRGR